MNKERLLQVREDIINSLDGVVGFNMANYVDVDEDTRPAYPDQGGHECGTVACIAGYGTIHRLMEERSLSLGDAIQAAKRLDVPKCNISLYAREWFELTPVQAERLFFGYGLDCDVDGADDETLNSITAQEAVAVIDHLIETGEVDWNA